MAEYIEYRFKVDVNTLTDESPQHNKVCAKLAGDNQGGGPKDRLVVVAGMDHRLDEEQRLELIQLFANSHRLQAENAELQKIVNIVKEQCRNADVMEGMNIIEAALAEKDGE